MGLAFGYVGEDPVRPLGSLGAEVGVRHRIIAHQAVNEARRGNVLRFVGWTVVGEGFTVGHGLGWMLVAYQCRGWRWTQSSRGHRNQPAGLLLLCHWEIDPQPLWAQRGSADPAGARMLWKYASRRMNWGSASYWLCQTLTVSYARVSSATTSSHSSKAGRSVHSSSLVVIQSCRAIPFCRLASSGNKSPSLISFGVGIFCSVSVARTALVTVARISYASGLLRTMLWAACVTVRISGLMLVGRILVGSY